MKDRSLIEEIKHKVTLVDVIRKFGGAELHGDGDTLTGWHKAHDSESKRSLHIDNIKGVWHCKNCGQGGDMFSYVGHLRRNGSYRDTDPAMFGEAMREIAAYAGVDIPDYDQEKAAERSNIEDVWQLAASFYHDELTTGHRAYFHNRRYTDETIDKCRLGYAPVGGRTLWTYLVKQHKISADDLLKTGLFIKHDNGNVEDHFQGRLMFPYLVHGRVAYFIGRITDQSPKWEHDRGMKYKKLLVHNDKHPYVSEQVSNRYFYGEDSVKPGGDLLITEGVADCLSALQAGYACVSPVTVRFAKKDHGKILEFAKRAGTVFICNDNEENNAGGDGTLATATMLWEHGIVAKLITLPRPEGVAKVDLNDFLCNPEQGPEAFKKLLPTAKTILDLKVDEIATCNDDAQLMALQSEVISLIAMVKSPYQHELWHKSLPAKLGMSLKGYNSALSSARNAIEEKEAAAKARAEEERAAVVAAKLDQLQQNAAPHPYVLHEGMIQIFNVSVDEETAEESETYTPICTFVAQIVGEIRDEFDNITYRIQGNAVRGGAFTADVDSESYGSPSKLKIALEAAAGPLDTVFSKMETHLGPAIKLLSVGVAVQRLKRYERTGWVDGKFYIPGRTPDGVLIELERVLPYALGPVTNTQAAVDALKLLMNATPATVAPILLASVLGPPIAALAGLDNHRYATMYQGQTGTYKTGTMMAYMACWGSGFLEKKNLIKWGAGATSKAVMHLSSSAYQLPYFPDNYKSNTGGGEREFVETIHAMIEGSERIRMQGKENKLRDIRPIEAWPICTGEDMPQGDPATLARFLTVKAHKSADGVPAGIKDPSAKHLPSIGAMLLDWLESDGSKEAVAIVYSTFDAKQMEWRKYLLLCNPGMPNVDRVASTLAINQAVFVALTKHPTFGHALASYLEKHTEGLRTIAEQMSGATADGLEAQRFVSAIREMLSTGRAILVMSPLHLEKMVNADKDKIIGWADGNGGAYLYPTTARMMVEKIMGVKLSDMSDSAIGNQLMELGWIGSHDKERSLKTKKINGNPMKVLHLNDRALMLPKVNHDEDDTAEVDMTF